MMPALAVRLPERLPYIEPLGCVTRTRRDVSLPAITAFSTPSYVVKSYPALAVDGPWQGQFPFHRVAPSFVRRDFRHPVQGVERAGRDVPLQ